MSSLQFPFQLDKRGRVATDLSRGAMDRSRVLFVLGTGVGERVMRPTYGTSIADAVAMVSPDRKPEDDQDPGVKDVIRTAIENAFEQLLPKLLLKDILFSTQFGRTTYMVDVYWAYKNPAVDSNRVENGLIDMRNLVNRIGAS